ncbi:hypothetical protein [Candidatus Mycoplasma haematohominis]|uniref:hypothetical protein n=1 Tax=Candidatus Mycoplasma haematohominis TaxID=1494318 RepID=UPI001C0A7084|nr:hypothetical protein [Candidatus Mycoplasma haemohominis]
MGLNGFITNLFFSFIGTSCTAFALAGESLDFYAVRVWDQYSEYLRKIDDLNKKSVWDEWVSKWVLLVVSHKSEEKKQLKSEYWRNVVIEIGSERNNEKFLNKVLNITEAISYTEQDANKNPYTKANDDKKQEWAKQIKNKKFLYPKVKKLQDECKWAYGRYINRSQKSNRSWLNSWFIRTGKEIKEDQEENWKYWNDVYVACSLSGVNDPLPPGWLAKDTMHLHQSYFSPKVKTTEKSQESSSSTTQASR